MSGWFVLAFLSALFSAASAIVEKKVLLRTPVLAFCVVSSFLHLLFVSPFALHTHPLAWTPVILSVVFVKSILAAAGYLYVMRAIQKLEISATLPLLVVTPGLVALLEMTFLGTFLTLSQWGGMLLLLGGTYALQLKGSGSLLDPFAVFFRSKDHHSIVIAVVLMAVASFLDKVALGRFKVPALDFLVLQMVFYFAFFALLFVFDRKSRRVGVMVPHGIRETWRGNWPFLVLLSVLTVSYRYTQILAVQLVAVSLVLSVKRLSVFFASVVGGRLFREGHLVRRALAAGVLLIGAALVLSKS